MMLQILRYSSILFLALVLVGVAQYTLYSIIGKDWADESLTEEYVYNLIISIVLGIVFVIVHRRQSDKLGFTFLGSISLKFILFFIFIYPDIRSDDEISRQEFANFFTPFLVCLIVELTFLLSLLRKES